jgi:hypothetical protein
MNLFSVWKLGEVENDRPAALLSTMKNSYAQCIYKEESTLNGIEIYFGKIFSTNAVSCSSHSFMICCVISRGTTYFTV